MVSYVCKINREVVKMEIIKMILWGLGIFWMLELFWLINFEDRVKSDKNYTRNGDDEQ